MNRTRTRLWTLLVCLFLAATTVASYWSVLHHQFVSYDDLEYVTSNPQVKAGLTWSSVKWAFTTGHAANWHPLTWLSHQLDAQMFGLSPSGHHLTNLVLHTVNAILLFLLLRSLTGGFWRCALVAAFFALHPLHVESVAWVSERKDVLSGSFFFLTLWAYAAYAKQKAETGKQKAAMATQSSSPVLRYSFSLLLALLCFALGLMSKPMLVTVPFVLLLLDFWPLNRVKSLCNYWSLVPEKIPFFALSLASCVATMLVQKSGGAVQPLSNLALGPRLANALVSYARYLGKSFWPFNLAAPYPRPDHWPVWEVAGAVILLLALTFLSLALSRKRPFLFTGWFWFVGMLVPVIGLVQVGDQAMADRYTYLPLIGIFIVLAWALPKRSAQVEAVASPAVGGEDNFPAPVWGVLAILMLAACAIRTTDQAAYWRNSEALFRHSAAVTRKNFLAHYNLGWELERQGRMDEAIVQYRTAAEIAPKFFDSWNNLGCALATQKKFAEAIPAFEAALRARPRSIEAHMNISRAFVDSGRGDQALPHYEAVLQCDSNHVDALNGLANALAARGEFAEAVAYYQSSLRAKMEQPSTFYNLGNALAKLRRLEEAIAAYSHALELPEARNDLGISLARVGRLDEAASHLRQAVAGKPSDAIFQCNLGRVLAAQQKLDEAIPCYEQALRLAPTNAEAHANLGLALALKNDLTGAVSHLQAALHLRPADPTAHYNLGKALLAQGKPSEAIPCFTEALRLRPNYTQARKELEALGIQVPDGAFSPQ